METDVVKGVNNKDNWGFGQERATFPSMVGCLEIFGNIPLWGYWRSCPDHLRTVSWSDHPWQTEQPRDQYGTAWPSN